MKKVFLLLLMLAFALPASSDSPDTGEVWRPPTINTCDRCPDPDGYVCAISPLACDQCWSTCGETSGTISRVRPAGAPYDPWLGDYRLDKTIGVIQLGYEQRPYSRLMQMTNLELAQELHSYGFNTMKVWMDTNPFEGMGWWCWSTYWGQEMCADYKDEAAQMREFWETAPLDTYFIRPDYMGWTWWGANECTGTAGPQMALADYYAIAKRLYTEFGWRDITVVLTDWEQDWVICNGYTEFLIDIIEQRQADVERARREAYLELGHRPKIRVMHSVIVNRYPNNTTDPELPRLAELIGTLTHKPDLIGLSYWRQGYDPIETLDWILEVTGYPRYRIYIDEFGSGKEDKQYDRFMEYIPAFWEWGIKTVNIWMWKQTWCGSAPGVQHGMWKQHWPCDGQVTFGEPTDGYYAIQELLRSVE